MIWQNLAIEQAAAEARGDQVLVPAMGITAASHVGVRQSVPTNTPFGKDSSGKYRRLGNMNVEEDLSTLLHRGLSVVKNLPKPQLAFQGMINNADEPFAPKLQIKHHAKVKNAGNLAVIDMDSDETQEWKSDCGSNAHPYDYELETFEIPDRQKQKLESVKLKSLDDVDFQMIDSKEGLVGLIEKLNAVQMFAHHNYRTFLGLTSLIQISTEDTDYVIDPFPIWGEMGLLNEPFTNPDILKIFHGAEEDVLWLQRDFGIYVVNMFDTHVAMKVLGMSRLSLQYLVENFCGITLGKELQKADWRIRPLTAAHIRYARSDTHYLIYCYQQLQNQLLNTSSEKDLLATVYVNSTNICRKIYEQPRFSESGYMKLIAHRRPTNQQIYALKRLWEWRDKTARQEDESPAFILPDQMLMQIAEVLPMEKQGIIACCSPIPVFLKRDILILHRIMIEARDLPLDRSGGPADVNDLSTTNFYRVVADFAERSQFEKRLEEMFNCDCNVDLEIQHRSEEMETDVENYGLNKDVVFTIGSTKFSPKNNDKFLRVTEETAKWATPFESYEIANTMKELRQKEDSNKEQVASNGPKMYTHHDPASQRVGTKSTVEVVKDTREKVELLDLTKSRNKRKIQQLKSQADIMLNGQSKPKREKMEQVRVPKTKTVEVFPQVVPEYDKIDASKFDQQPDTSGVYNPYQGSGRGRGARGRGKGRGRARGRGSSRS
uniref:HRDC domain-containing protein n=3 Tax=Panagrolaimus sp. JU765 TaxID=591449 RepID=A0AC34QGP7_9BILA